MSGKPVLSAAGPQPHAEGRVHSRAKLRQWVGACLLWALAVHLPAVAQSVAPTVSRAVEVPPPADWKPGAPLFADEGPADSGRVPVERAKQLGEPRALRERAEAAIVSNPPSQRVTTKPLAPVAKKPSDPGRGQAVDKARPKAQGVAKAKGEAAPQAKPPRASRVAGSGLNPVRRAADVGDGVRQRAGQQGSQNKVAATARAPRSGKVGEKAQRGVASQRQASTSLRDTGAAKSGERAARTRKLDKGKPARSVEGRAVRSGRAPAAEASRDRPQAKRPAARSTRSVQAARPARPPQAARSARSVRPAKAEAPPQPRATTRPSKRAARGARSQPATPGDAKQAVRRAR